MKTNAALLLSQLRAMKQAKITATVQYKELRQILRDNAGPSASDKRIAMDDRTAREMAHNFYRSHPAHSPSQQRQLDADARAEGIIDR